MTDNVHHLGARRPGGGESWTPREALQYIMDQIDKGELQADNVVIGVLTIQDGGKVGITCSFSAPNIAQTLGALELMKDVAKG